MYYFKTVRLYTLVKHVNTNKISLRKLRKLLFFGYLVRYDVRYESGHKVFKGHEDIQKK